MVVLNKKVTYFILMPVLLMNAFSADARQSMVDIASMIKVVSKSTDETYVIPEELSNKKVVVYGAGFTSMSKAELLFILAQLNYTLVNNNGVNYVTHLTYARPVLVNGESKKIDPMEVVSKVIPLNHIAPETVITVLQSLAPQGAYIKPYAKDLLAVGYHINVEFISQLAFQLDSKKNAEFYQRKGKNKNKRLALKAKLKEAEAKADLARATLAEAKRQGEMCQYSMNRQKQKKEPF